MADEGDAAERAAKAARAKEKVWILCATTEQM